MTLTAPVVVPSFTVDDQRALDGLQWALDAYNAEQRAANPAWVDVQPMPYLKARVLGWLRREADRRDPATSNDIEAVRAAFIAYKASHP